VSPESPLLRTERCTGPGASGPNPPHSHQEDPMFPKGKSGGGRRRSKYTRDGCLSVRPSYHPPAPRASAIRTAGRPLTPNSPRKARPTRRPANRATVGEKACWRRSAPCPPPVSQGASCQHQVSRCSAPQPASVPIAKRCTAVPSGLCGCAVMVRLGHPGSGGCTVNGRPRRMVRHRFSLHPRPIGGERWMTSYLWPRSCSARR
jgi:hypothetical protein